MEKVDTSLGNKIGLGAVLMYTEVSVSMRKI